jgi:hypothetical protein
MAMVITNRAIYVSQKETKKGAVHIRILLLDVQATNEEVEDVDDSDNIQS